MMITVVENLIVTEILFAIVWFVAILVLREFIRAKDGMLRIIMIAYFSVEIFTYLGSAVYFYFLWKAPKNVISGDLFRLIIILPKVGVKLWLLWWLKKGRFLTKFQ